MSRRHSRLVEYFITVGIEFESVAPINDESISYPIRELRIVSEKEQLPEGFEQITTTVTGKDASLTKKGMMNRNTKHYLCYSRESSNTLFTRIQYLKAKHISPEWNRVPGKIMNGKTEFCLCTKNDPSVPPIADICIITVDGKESCPEGYVKLPHTINSLAICFRHLPMDALGLRYQTCILDRYPRTDYPESPLSNTVAVFCQPNGADIRSEASMPTFLSFVLTDSEGRKMYAITITFYDKLEEEDEQCCKRALEQIYTDGFRPMWPDKDKTKQLYHSKSVCILSYYPFFLSFREVLKEIYRLANSPGRIPIERYVTNICEETPLPIPSRRSVQLLYAHKPIIFRIPNDDELPMLDSNIKKIFCCLSLNNTLLLFKVLITQKYKILFTSLHISLITEICEGLVSFMQPFEWQFAYVPVLPYSVFGILDAPLPVLVGMHSSRIRPDYYSDPTKELIIVDLDNNNIHMPSNLEMIDVPSQMHKPLKHELKQFANANKVELFDKNNIQFVDSAFNVHVMMDHDDDEAMQQTQFNAMACRAAFYKFWIKALGPSYQQFLLFPEEDDIMDINDIFDIDAFIASRPKNIRKFWKQFTETQAFQKFVEDLTFEPNEDRSIALRAFYRCCQHEHKNDDGSISNSTIDSSYISPKLPKVSSSSHNLSISSNSMDPINLPSTPLSQHNGDNSNGSTMHAMQPSNPNLDPFTDFLCRRIPQLKPFQVPQANEAELDKDYRFEVKSAFPTLNDKFITTPRKTNLSQIIQEEESNLSQSGINAKASEEEKKYEQDANSATISPRIQINDHDMADLPNGGRARGGQSRGARKGSAAKWQTPIDRAKYQLLQVYGTWFAVHVAALDFKDIPGDEVEMVVKSTLDVLYRMSDANTSRDVLIIPDELIYKACLILCGKFGKKKEASKLFKDLKKNGITPSQKTYGAYTNAMASSGANMLLSAAGSTSSGTSSMAGRTHRRSFAPTVDALSLKARSLSAAVNANSRLHAPHKINTISEDAEQDNQIKRTVFLDSPLSPDEEEQKTPTMDFFKSPSSPFVTLQPINDAHSTDPQNDENNDNNQTEQPSLSKANGGHGAHKSVEITLLSNESAVTYEDDNKQEASTAAPALSKTEIAKSSPIPSMKENRDRVSIPDSESTITPSPKVELENGDHFNHNNGNVPNGGHAENAIKRDVWKQDEESSGLVVGDELERHEEHEAKQSQPTSNNTTGSSSVTGPSVLSTPARTGNTTLTVTSSSSTYSTPSVLSSEQAMLSDGDSLQRADSLNRTESIRDSNYDPEALKQLSEKIAVIIDYGTLHIEVRHECKCGYVLSDAQMMVGWCSEFAPSKELRCIICTQNTFEPRLHLKYNTTKMSMKNGICSFDVVDKYVDYISPLQLRNKVNSILNNRRLDFEEPETFRSKHEVEFWNMLWYFYNRGLDLSFLLGEHDASALGIKAFNHLNENAQRRLEPKSDDELLEKLQPIYEKASERKLREAISAWLMNRSQTPSEKRDLSIWNLSVFDSFHDLGIPSKFDNYESFINEFKNACRIVRPKMKDRAWDEAALSIQICFKHPRISNPRLQLLTPRLSGKPLRPNVPVPVPPSKK